MCIRDSFEDGLQQALAMFLREGATNILRHAGARRVVIDIRRQGGALEGRLLDDGQGGVHYAGRGLDGLRDRLAGAGLVLTFGEGLDGKGAGLTARETDKGRMS